MPPKEKPALLLATRVRINGKPALRLAVREWDKAGSMSIGRRMDNDLPFPFMKDADTAETVVGQERPKDPELSAQDFEAFGYRKISNVHGTVQKTGKSITYFHSGTHPVRINKELVHYGTVRLNDGDVLSFVTGDTSAGHIIFDNEGTLRELSENPRLFERYVKQKTGAQ